MDSCKAASRCIQTLLAAGWISNVLMGSQIGTCVHVNDSLRLITRYVISGLESGSFHVRSTNGLRVTPPISMKVGTRADNA